MTASSGNNRKNLKPTYRKPTSNRTDGKQSQKDEKRQAGSGVSNEGHGKATDESAAKASVKSIVDAKPDKDHGDKTQVGQEKKPEKRAALDDKKPEGREGKKPGDPDERESRKAEKDPKGSKSPSGKHGVHAKEPDKKKDKEKASASGEKLPSMPKKRPVGAIIGGAVAAVLVVVCMAFGISFSQGSNEPAALDIDSLRFSDTAYNEAGELVNQVDWDAWTARNPDVYAWLQIDGTNVDYPILQHPVVDDYYLMRNVDGEPEVNGTLYTQVGYNTKDFEEDPVTIIYGHTFEKNDTMFTTLHNLENQEFFDVTPTFYIYTPDERLEYEIVSAFEYDNSHILDTQDMADMQVRSAFFDMVQNPDSINKKVRKLEEKLDPQEDNLLILSTCTQPANDNARYLVVAVLKNVESTEDVDMSEDSTVLEEHTMTQEELDALPDVELE